MSASKPAYFCDASTSSNGSSFVQREFRPPSSPQYKDEAKRACEFAVQTLLDKSLDFPGACSCAAGKDGDPFARLVGDCLMTFWGCGLVEGDPSQQPTSVNYRGFVQLQSIVDPAVPNPDWVRGLFGRSSSADFNVTVSTIKALQQLMCGKKEVVALHACGLEPFPDNQPGHTGCEYPFAAEGGLADIDFTKALPEFDDDGWLPEKNFPGPVDCDKEECAEENDAAL